MASLVIAGQDVEKYIIQDNFQINITAKFDESAGEFTNIYGQKRKQRIGSIIAISADLISVPTATASVILAGCQNPDGVSISGNAAISFSGTCREPNVSATLSFTENRGDMYDMHIDMSFDDPLDGL
jgi:hypothetical protein